jgi:protein-tyrosine phosphatase
MLDSAKAPELGDLPVKLDFEGPSNFRDLGGYPTADGRRLKRGLLFRSDHLGHLTDVDQELIADLGIKTVVDLRRQRERDEILDRIDDPEITQIWLPVASEGSDVQDMRRGLEAGLISPARAHQYLVDANREFVRIFGHVFQAFLHLLLEEESYPLVFHCTAGKDRAGFAAALSLISVGASLETVFHDYLATNHCTANYVNGILDGLNDTRAMKADPEAVRTLMQVQPAFLGAALDAMAEDFGDVDSYLEQALTFDAAKRERLRSILCE